MHIEVQVALNFVISYLYNKLPRRRVNIFGEELEKALKDKFQGHWYPEKPFKGSAFRCLKTGDPIDAVLHRAARESGVPISDILENLPAELAVWVDPGEVSYRIGEKGAVKILFSEFNDHRLEDTKNADREVTKTFNPEAQCFRPIDAVSTSMSGLSLSPKITPHNSPPTSAASPAAATNFIKNSNSPAINAAATVNGANNTNSNSNSNNNNSVGNTMSGGNSFLPRSQHSITFTTATFAQTKFGSTKLKSTSKRTNSRMSPTEFSNYIKQRAMQQQLHHSHNGHPATSNLGPVSPARSLSPNPLSNAILNGGSVNGTLPNNSMQDPYFFSGSNSTSMASNLYPPQQYGRSNMFDSNGASSHFPASGYTNGFGNVGSSFLEPNNFYGMGSAQQQQTGAVGAIGGMGSVISHGALSNGQLQLNGSSLSVSSSSVSALTAINSPGSSANNPDQTSNNLLDGMNSFYSNQGPYQHLLVAN